MSELEAVLAHNSMFEQLRPDEIGRIARRFAITSLARGEQFEPREATLLIVVRGEVAVAVTSASGVLRARMTTGDRFGTYSLLTGIVKPFVVEARTSASVATIDRATFDAILAEFPVVALPLSREVAKELSSRHDSLRQLLELHAEHLPAAQLTAAIEDRRIAQQRTGAHVTRMSARGLFQRLVVQQGAEPPFWMLLGFLLSLGGARLIVHLILKYKLESQLFALVPGNDPNPMHVHHFNYGLVLIAAAGLAALFPFGRRGLRALALVFGLGAGLVFDEFALFWNLDPEYSQELSVIAAGIAAAVLLQLTYFRKFWGALARRAWLGLRGAR